MVRFRVYSRPQSVDSEVTMKRAVFHLLIVAFCLGLFSSCAKDLITGKGSYNWYKVPDDSKLGSYVMQQQLKALKKENKEVDSPRNAYELAQIREIVARIGAVSHYPDFPWEVHVASIPIVNAWCAPGGKIMVYEGLWDPKKGLIEKDNEDQLAAVLAHEIAHATARHVTESLSTNMTIMMAGQVASTAISAASVDGANIFNDIFTNGMNIFVPSYSRKNELEADRIGLLYMAKAGYDPRAAIALWKKAAQQKKDPGSVFASHPTSGMRAAELEKYLPEAMKIYDDVNEQKAKSEPPKKVKKHRKTIG